jgi:hypothetical protein
VDWRRHPDAGQSSRKRTDVNACGSPRSPRTVSRGISSAFIGGRRTPPSAPRVGAIRPGSFPPTFFCALLRFAATSQTHPRPRHRHAGQIRDAILVAVAQCARPMRCIATGIRAQRVGSWGDNGVGGGGGEVSLEQRSRGEEG